VAGVISGRIIQLEIDGFVSWNQLQSTLEVFIEIIFLAANRDCTFSLFQTAAGQLIEDLFTICRVASIL
jgi:hypothetical protein